MRLAVLACALSACAYQPGSFAYFAQHFPGKRVTVGCIDLAVQRRASLTIGAVLEYQFGNRCDQAAVVDLAHARVRGRAADGSEVDLVPFDPNGEIHRERLDGRRGGTEALAYGGDTPLAQVCVDAASVADVRGEQWLCFAAADPVIVGSP